MIVSGSFTMDPILSKNFSSSLSTPPNLICNWGSTLGGCKMIMRWDENCSCSKIGLIVGNSGQFVFCNWSGVYPTWHTFVNDAHFIEFTGWHQSWLLIAMLFTNIFLDTVSLSNRVTIFLKQSQFIVWSSWLPYF